MNRRSSSSYSALAACSRAGLRLDGHKQRETSRHKKVVPLLWTYFQNYKSNTKSALQKMLRGPPEALVSQIDSNLQRKVPLYYYTVSKTEQNFQNSGTVLYQVVDLCLELNSKRSPVTNSDVLIPLVCRRVFWFCSETELLFGLLPPD